MDMLPADYRAHRRAAKRERLLSWRSLLDAAIEQLDEVAASQGGHAGQLPAAFWAHRRAAYREDLLAFRSLVDAGIGWLEQPSQAEQASRIDVA
jgi:hypothetical protein